MKAKTLMLASILMLISCSDDSIEIEQQVYSANRISCDDYKSVSTENGLLYNNVWNKQAAKNKTHSQCLIERAFKDKKQYGWSWDWPAGNRVIYAYPQIKVGASPWQPTPNFNDAFPAQIDALKSLSLSFQLDILTTSNYNIASSMWVTKSPVSGTEPQPSSIAAEIMVWTYATSNHFNPAGQKTDEFTLGNNTWEVWVNKNWKDASGANDNKWIYIAFKAKTNSFSQNIDMLGLLNYAVAKQLIQSDYYVADIELGNEIMGGKGVAWVNSFNVSVQ